MKLAFGDVHIHVSDFDRALRFWAEGLRLTVLEQEVSAASAFAVLEFPDDGIRLRLFAGSPPWPKGAPEPGERPMICFDIEALDFDATLVGLLEHGGTQMGEIETYNNVRVVTVADPDGNSFELIQCPDDDE